MKREQYILWILVAGLGLLVSCSPFQSDQDFSPLPPTETDASSQIVSPTVTPQPVCTPPPCDENESYFCPDQCPGGCGTVCATHTPTSTPVIQIPIPIRFAVIGDYGLAGEPASDVTDLVKSWEPDFIITVGDNNYPDGSALTIDQNIGQYYHDYIHPYVGEYGDGAEENRFFPTLGNHDWTEVQAYLDYFTLPNNERYYDFEWGPVHLFAINGDSREPDGVGRSSIQAGWLKEKLAESAAPWKIVYFHQPPYSSGQDGSVDWMQWPFTEWGADAVISGHEHVYERLIVDGIPYFVNGLGGGERYFFGETHPNSQIRYREDYGAMIVEATETSLRFVFETRNHEIVDAYMLEQPVEESDEQPSVQTFPNPGAYRWVPVVTGLTSPVGLTHAGDGSGRLFIIEQSGVIRVVQDGVLLPDPFLDIRDRVTDSGNEQGLLGLAFHPDYENNGYFFVDYTGKNDATFVSRFQVGGEPNQADPNSEKILLKIDQPYGNHNGGHLVFGPDGYLYIGTGDGGSANDPQGNAQNLNTLLGKLLRIDVNFGDPYAVPDDNPYVGVKGRSEIWASGLRNPWRFSFDSSTGDLYVGDVGQNQWEEINFLTLDVPGGTNFGWDFWEGFHPFEGTPPEGLKLTLPIWEYDHAQGCSVTGGVVYRGSLSEWQGIYLFGDFCSGIVWGLLRDADGAWQHAELFQSGANIASFGEDESGEVYLVNRQGTVLQLQK